MNRNKKHKQSGQTLIETIVAIFVLTTALSAGLGLTIYAFSSASTSQNEIIASNLAREGVEVVRMMRDSNWLAGDSSVNPIYNLTGCSDIGDKLCYPNAFNGPAYSLSAGNQRAIFNPELSTWSLDSTVSYDLFLQADKTYTHTANGSSVFARMINIISNANPPFTSENSNQELVVQSIVAWRGKNCPAFNSSQNILTFVTPCKVVVEEHLTNWKDYR